MPMSYGDVWRRVRLHAPNAPARLVQTWVMDTYRNLIDKRGWLFRTLSAQLPVLAARTITVTVTLGSDIVTSAGLFVSTDEGRCFSSGTYPLYQINRFLNANTLQLTLPYYGTGTGAIPGLIQDAYATMPTDFGRFVVVVDPVQQLLVPWWATQMELDALDPTRTAATATARLLVAAQPSPCQATRGQTQYEYWPKPQAAGALQYSYIQRPTQLQDDDVFAGVLRDRTDVLELGALMRLAQWPGTKDAPNPYFNLQLAKLHADQYAAAALQLDLRDDDQGQQSWDTQPWQRAGLGWAYPTHLLQASDATLSDYAGGGSGLW